MLRNFQNSKTSSISFIRLDPHLYLCDVLKIRLTSLVCTSFRIVSYNAAKFSKFINLFYFVHPFGSPPVPLRCPQISQTSCSLYIPSDPQIHDCENVHRLMKYSITCNNWTLSAVRVTTTTTTVIN